jgi:NADH dehydrogenase FAD-containing subunit
VYALATDPKPRVVIVGAGFGGLQAALHLARLPVKITLIDRRNFHTFQPLLYQVATAGLSPGEIAAPIRWIVRGRRNIEVLLGEVQDFDLEQRRVKLPDLEVPYDYLIVAAGASHAYFGHDEWEPFAPGLKTIEDALEIRRRFLLAFELDERQAASGSPQQPLNFVIVGGGPTGVELAGTLAEISRQVLANQFQSIDPKSTRIILLEGGPRILPAYPEDLSRSAEEQLRHLGVDVRTSTMVTGVEAGAVRMGEAHLSAAVILWAAGVAASPLGKKLGAPIDRAGRVLVNPDLSIPGHPEVFVIGDLAFLKGTRRHAGGPCHRSQHWARAARRAPQQFPLCQQGQSCDHRPRRRRRRIRQTPHLRLPRMAILAVHSYFLSYRIPQPHPGDDPVGMVVLDLRARRPPDHWRSDPSRLDGVTKQRKVMPAARRSGTYWHGKSS